MTKEITSKKGLAICLSKLLQIKGVDRCLEQYQTDSELASDILWQAYMQRDVQNCIIFDLGCGNGVFGIGSLLLGAKKCYFLDKDPNAIAILRQNVRVCQGNYEIIANDIEHEDFSMVRSERTASGDVAFKRVAIMNPPFGTKKKHADGVFIKKATSFADIVYSIHTKESFTFLKSIAEDEGFRLTSYWDSTFIIKKSHVMHKRNKYPVPVVIIRLEKLSKIKK